MNDSASPLHYKMTLSLAKLPFCPLRFNDNLAHFYHLIQLFESALRLKVARSNWRRSESGTIDSAHNSGFKLLAFGADEGCQEAVWSGADGS